MMLAARCSRSVSSHHLADERAGLAEVIVLGVQLVGVVAELCRFDHPARRFRRGIGPRAAVAVRGIDRLAAGVPVGHVPSFI